MLKTNSTYNLRHGNRCHGNPGQQTCTLLSVRRSPRSPLLSFAVFGGASMKITGAKIRENVCCKCLHSVSRNCH